MFYRFKNNISNSNCVFFSPRGLPQAEGDFSVSCSFFPPFTHCLFFIFSRIFSFSLSLPAPVFSFCSFRQSLFFPLSLPYISLSLYRYRSLSLSLSHTHAHSLNLSRSLSRLLSLSLFLAVARSRSRPIA